MPRGQARRVFALATHVEGGEHHDHIAFDREAHGVGKSSEQRAADARPKILILEGPSAMCSGGAPLIEKLQPK